MKGNKNNDFLVNEAIHFAKVNVIAEDKEFLGTMELRDALEKAHEKGLDLVVVNQNDEIPVAKIMDYSRFKFEKKKKRKQSQHGQKKQCMKEIKMKLNTDVHDYQTKLKKAKSFLEKNDKVRFSIRLRGREIGRASLVCEVFDKIKKDLEGLAILDTASSSDIREAKNNYLLVFFPITK